MPIRELDRFARDSLKSLMAKGLPVPACEECGEPRRSRANFCSEKCKRRYKRRRKNPRPLRWVVCRYCGDEFPTTNPRQVACAGETAELECVRARSAFECVKEESQEEPCQGPGCENDVGGADTGRPRSYCSRSCQAKAYRARKAKEKKQ